MKFLWLYLLDRIILRHHHPGWSGMIVYVTTTLNWHILYICGTNCACELIMSQGFARAFMHISKEAEHQQGRQNFLCVCVAAPRGAEFVRGAHRETELRKKLKPTQPANSSVRPWKGGVLIYKVQFGGGANYLLAWTAYVSSVQVLWNRHLPDW